MWDTGQVSNWFLVRHSSEMQRDEAVDEKLTQMKLHKLMYYAQGVNLAVFSERLFGDEILAWKYGPVVRSVYDRFKGQRELSNVIDDCELDDYEKISADENTNMVLEAVYDKFGGYSAGQLRNMTHNEAPWIEAYNEGRGSSSMDDKLIEEYFKENVVEV